MDVMELQLRGEFASSGSGPSTVYIDGQYLRAIAPAPWSIPSLLCGSPINPGEVSVIHAVM